MDAACSRWGGKIFLKHSFRSTSTSSSSSTSREGSRDRKYSKRPYREDSRSDSRYGDRYNDRYSDRSRPGYSDFRQRFVFFFENMIISRNFLKLISIMKIWFENFEGKNKIIRLSMLQKKTCMQTFYILKILVRSAASQCIFNVMNSRLFSDNL